MYNPSLRQQSRHEAAPPIPLSKDVSILEWLERTGRLTARDDIPVSYLEAEVELDELMGGEDDTDFDPVVDDEDV